MDRHPASWKQMMNEVDPWVPMEVVWSDGESNTLPPIIVSPESIDAEVASIIGPWFPTFTLANFQRVIVRPLSEDRREARRNRFKGAAQ